MKSVHEAAFWFVAARSDELDQGSHTRKRLGVTPTALTGAEMREMPILIQGGA